MSAGRRALVSALAVFSVSAQAQEHPASEPGQTPFDLTGAGSLVLGDIDAVLRPHRRALDRAEGRLPLKLTIANTGAVIGCKGGDGSLSAVSDAICAHAIRDGRFERSPIFTLDYSEATYHVTISARDKGKGSYWLATDYPDIGAAVRFGDYRVPPAKDRLSATDLRSIPMSYPRAALSRGYGARVVVALTFGEDGHVLRCRPVTSSNSSRMAYDTCRAASRSYRLLDPPDPRPYVFATSWILSD